MSLAPRWVLNGLDLTASPFLVEMNAANHGAPDSVRSVLGSMLADGDIDLIDRHGNRTFVIPVLLEGSLDDMAAAETSLVAAARQARGTLLFDPGDGSAPVSVFETFAADVVLDQNEDADSAGLRRATLTIPCRPFARPDSETTIDAPTVIGSTTTVVDTGSSTTGWSLLGDSAVTQTAWKNLIDPDAWVASTNATGVSGNTSLSTGLVWSPSATGKAYVNSNLMTVTPSTTYTVAMSLKVNDAGKTRTMGFLYRWYLSDGTTQVGSDATLSASVSAGAFVDKQWNITAPATGVRLRIYPFVTATATSDDVTMRYVSTRLTSETGPDNPNVGYFDGATTDNVGINYTWDGVANQSTSTGTWTAPALAVVSGAVKGTTYGRSFAGIRRTGAVTMTTLNYMRITGTAGGSGTVTVADNGEALTPLSYSYNSSSGAFVIVIKRPTGFTTVDVTFATTLDMNGTTVSVSVDQIEITDNPFATGKTQSRQVQILGAQRTELSLSVMGLDNAGTTAVGLGEQVLVHTASAGSDGRAKFLSARTASALGGTADSTAASGAYNTVPNSFVSPTQFTFAAASLLPGNYLAVARMRTATAGSTDLYVRANVDAASPAPDVYDPPTGWRTLPLVAATGSPTWPTAATNTWIMIPLGIFRLPPADVEDPTATISVQLARGTNAVDVDDVFLLNADVGQTSIIITGPPGSQVVSAVRLDAATVDAPQASAWVGTANGAMIADLTRWVGEQHAAEPGLLQIATVTPGCATSRVSASYYRRYHTHVADEATA